MRVEVSVVPGSGSFRFSKTKDGKLKVYLKSKAENNKANIELIKKLGKLLKCEIGLVSGARSRHKCIELELSEDKWEKFLARIKE